jgi:hypothetical protein
MITAPYADSMESSPPRSGAVNESDMELRANNRDLDEMRATEPEFSLPPVDGGMAAWLFLFSAFVLEILVWGRSFRFCSHVTSSTSTLLTIHRVSFRFRYIPRILHLEPTIRRLPEHTYCRDLRNGPNVPSVATHLRFLRVVS